MAKLTLQILGQTSGGDNSIDAVIARVKADLKKLEAPIKITVTGSGGKALEQQAAAVERSAAREVKAREQAASKAEKAQQRAAAAAEKAAEREKKAREQAVQALVKAARQAEDAADRQAEKEETAFQRMKRAVVNMNREVAAETERFYQQQEQAQQRAADSQTRLQGEYARFIRQVQNLKAQYPEGTFDAIEQQAKEAQAALQGLNVNTEDGRRKLEGFNRTLLGLKTGFQTAQQETKKLDKVTESLWMNLQKFARWWIVGGVVTTITRSLREAIKTMKEVDQQLTNIAKVSDISASELKRIGDSAYDTASKYGVAAEQYLEAVYTFQKAGLGGSSEGLAELATKTMLVGDTTSEVATKFLIAANAAWKYGGDVEKLSAVVDQADYLNNNFAVSLEDIASALPIVASTAAQAGLSVEQTMAAITTIVAQTAQSGNRAGTALRAIIMNLAGETGALEDGFEVTKDSIKSLNGILLEFAPDAVAAAQAAGKIVDPMVAIAALAKAASEDEDALLNSAELFKIVSELGGKLRANQLNALIEGQETYNKALAGTADAAGTADKEISTMLESWNSKTQILKNTWTQFISHMLDSGALKGLIDGLTGLVKILDTGFGRATIRVLAFSAALIVIPTVIAKIKALLAASSFISGLTALLSGLITTITGLTTATELFSVVWAASPLFVISLGVGAVYGLVAAIDALNVTTQEHLDKAKKYSKAAAEESSEAENLKQKLKENNELIAKGNELGKSDAYITRLQKENVLLAEQIRLKQNDAAEDRRKADEAARKASDKNGYTIHTGEYIDDELLGREEITYSANIVSYTDYLLDAAEAGGKVSEELKTVIQTVSELSGQFDESIPGSQEYIDVLIALIKRYNDLYEAEHGAAEGTGDVGDGLDTTTEKVEEQVDRLKELNDQIDSVQDALKTLQSAQEEYNETGAISVDTMQKLISLDPEYLDALINEAGEIDVNSVAVSNLIDGKNILLDRLAAEAVAAYAVSEAERLAGNETSNAGNAASSASGKLVDAAGASFRLAQDAATAAVAVGELRVQLAMLAADYGLSGASSDELVNNVMSYRDNLASIMSGTGLGLGSWSGSSGGGGGGGGSGGGSGSETDEYLESLKSAVSLEKQRLSLLEASGASIEEQADQTRIIQDLIQEEIDYLQSIGAEEEDILKLQTEWWNLQNSITKLMEESLKDWLEAESSAATQALRDQLEILKEQAAAVSEEREEEEKLLAVEKARVALANAQNERSVRQYNAQTGTWEWVADAQAVAAAQENLDAAEQALADYYAEQEIAALEQQIEEIESIFSGLESTIHDLAVAIATGAATFEETIANLALQAGVGSSIPAPSAVASALGLGAAGTFGAKLESMGIVTAAARSAAGFAGGMSGSRIGSQHNGNVYQFGSISLSEAQAKGMTVYDLAQMAGTLSLCANAV